MGYFKMKPQQLDSIVQVCSDLENDSCLSLVTDFHPS